MRKLSRRTWVVIVALMTWGGVLAGGILISQVKTPTQNVFPLGLAIDPAEPWPDLNGLPATQFFTVVVSSQSDIDITIHLEITSACVAGGQANITENSPDPNMPSTDSCSAAWLSSAQTFGPGVRDLRWLLKVVYDGAFGQYSLSIGAYSGPG